MKSLCGCNDRLIKGQCPGRRVGRQPVLGVIKSGRETGVGDEVWVVGCLLGGERAGVTEDA